MSETKRPWDTSKAGLHPAFTKDAGGNVVPKRATNAEIEAVKRQARELASGPGRALLTERSRFLADSEAAAEHHRVNLELAIKEKMDFRIQAAHRLAYAMNLVNLGLFTEAAALISDKKGRALGGFKDLLKRITKLEHAVNRDDADECKCKRRRHTVSHHSQPTEHEIELPRRHNVGMVFSPKHGRVVDLWECYLCGHCNAHPNGPPASQAHIHAARAAAAQTIKTAADLDNPRFNAWADHSLLKPVA
jgi:hypothetical protein